MKKLIAFCTLIGCSFGVIAEQAVLPLQKDQRLSVSALQPTTIQEGQKLNNVLFSVEANTVQGNSNFNLSKCLLSADLNLQAGQLHFNNQQLRCISEQGDIFTNNHIEAKFINSTNSICTSTNRCKSATFNPEETYNFSLNQASQLTAEFNAMLEVNKNRLSN